MKKSSSILLTGSTGSLGSAILKKLPSDKNVILLQRSQPTNTFGKLHSINTNLLDSNKVLRDLKIFEKIDTIVHVAGVTDSHVAERNGNFQDNVTMAKSITTIAKNKGVSKLIFISSNAVNYSNRPYATSKKAAEEIIASLNIPSIIIRPTLILGPNSKELKRLKMATSHFPLFPLINKGEQKIQPIYVDDVASFVNHVIDKTRVKSATYSIGGKDIITTKELLNLTSKNQGKSVRFINIPTILFDSAFALTRILGIIRLSSLKDSLTTDLIVDNNKAMTDYHWEPLSFDEMKPLLFN